MLKVGPLKLDLLGWEAYYQDEEIFLPRTEFKLLKILMSRPGEVVTNNELMPAFNLCNNIQDGRQMIRTYIAVLRNKIDYKFNVTMIKTVYGVGYKIRHPKMR